MKKDCNCDSYEIIACDCEHIDINFEDLTENVDLDFIDESEGIDVGIVDVGPVLINNEAVVLKGTTEYWNSRPDLVSRKNVFYMYLDYLKIENGGEVTYKPGLKIGDGLAYVVDLPFIAGFDLNITKEDVDRWDGKWRGYIDPNFSENLVFTTN